MNMIERVARAINAWYVANSDDSWQRYRKEDSWKQHVEIAKLMIEAMREPTEELALYIKGLRYDVEHIANYRKIIDAALKEE